MSAPSPSDSVESREEILARHKKESKDLIATITGLKKQATKKTRKNVNAKCQEMQDALEARHKEELDQFDEPRDSNEEITPEQLLAQLELEPKESQPAEMILESETSTKPKRNRQKERLEKRKAEIDRIRQEAAAEAANTVDYRQIEIESMDALLQLNNLKVHQIKPDGHCLFASIQDQLLVRHDIEKSISELRKLSADYIKEHKDDFLPFMFDEQTGELNDIDKYTDELAHTAMWGSDMEILALSKIFDSQIDIFIAGASTIIINEGANNPTMKLGYFKHSYGLGEHYNSLRDL